MAIKDRGFASMSPETQRKIASMGGKYAHWKGTAHQWNSDEARGAGRRGGIATALVKKRKQAGVGSPAPILDPISDPAVLGLR